MSQSLHRIVVISPFEQPDADLVIAAGRAGALGVLDLGRDEVAAKRALARLGGETDGSLGVRVPPGVSVHSFELPRSVGTVMVAAGTEFPAGHDLRVYVQVTDAAEEIDRTEQRLHELIDQLRVVAGVVSQPGN